MLPHHISEYWGKARPTSIEEPQWHPLAYHGLDVAAAGEAIIEARPHFLEALSRLSGLPRELTRNWLLLVLAVHDLGKFAECFQVKCECIRSDAATRSRLPGPLADDPGHGAIGVALWQREAARLRA